MLSLEPTTAYLYDASAVYFKNTMLSLELKIMQTFKNINVISKTPC